MASNDFVLLSLFAALLLFISQTSAKEISTNSQQIHDDRKLQTRAEDSKQVGYPGGVYPGGGYPGGGYPGGGYSGGGYPGGGYPGGTYPGGGYPGGGYQGGGYPGRGYPGGDPRGGYPGGGYPGRRYPGRRSPRQGGSGHGNPGGGGAFCQYGCCYRTYFSCTSCCSAAKDTSDKNINNKKPDNYP